MAVTKFNMDTLFSLKYHKFFISILIILILGLAIVIVSLSANFGHSRNRNKDIKLSLRSPSTWTKQKVILSQSHSQTNQTCNFFNCFNIYRCGHFNHKKLSVFVYPLIHYQDADGLEIKTHSKEFLKIIEAIASSEYYYPSPDEACLFMPSIDTLNENDLRKDEISQILSKQKYWNSGENHLIFNFLPGTPPDFLPFGVSTAKALIAGGSFSSYSYRQSFDISIPVYNPLHQSVSPSEKPISKRQWLIMSSQINIHQDYRNDLQSQISDSNQLFVLENCPSHDLTKRCFKNEVFDYPQILSEGKFCLVIRGGRLGQTVLYDAMRSGCIPIVAADSYVMPYNDVIDWRRAAIIIYEQELPDVVSIIEKNVSYERMVEMQKQMIWLYKTYFADIEKITLTTLDILNERVFGVNFSNRKNWNERPQEMVVKNPLFLPDSPPVSDGFTAVILAYDRIDSLIQVVKNIEKVPSISKILIVWNNERKKPPTALSWLKPRVPLEIVEMKANKLSNRFVPFKQIETECVLAIDDDINMLTADELEFGYRVWLEFPDRIVGFPSRNVVWNNVTMSWRYDSEWTNEVSMVLTGVAFYHKYWSYEYSTQLPGDMKSWVDTHLNCEDIAMNFLVANKTGKAPIKVTPRKKFKCSQCTSGDLSANEAHLAERSQCVNYFTKIFGTMPLKAVEFRVDPVLFKENNLPSRVKLFDDIGSL